MMAHCVPDLEMGCCSLEIPNIEQTHHQVSVTRTMHLVGDVDRTASAIGNSYLAFLRRLEVPNSVIVFRVFEQLLRCHGRHGGCLGRANLQ